ncbi:amino acid adenylation domain-containing protein [Gordonia westfalica]|uniref:Amino acid adenylation domain-containing protein n=1 Tax=Gordonia westfalica TaxID=158898 RepID=A0ABU2GQZ2_9ACTN|nr:non-ribosomal peptide synthetase [Gordonia westfalica]MDS1113878.1 amino acid adenylation domain-containing protein [Gordonia westfalica]
MTDPDNMSRRPAIIDGSREVSRREFDSRVAMLARELIARGVRSEVAVGIQMDRSIEQVIAIHAVVTAGGHFVPLDAQLPVDRSRYMMSTAGVRLVIVTSGGKAEAMDRFGDIADLHVFDGASPIPDDSPIADADRALPVRPDNAAFTLFTSGSTGRPKAVVITHEGVANRLEADAEQYGLSAEDVFLYKAPINFDVAVREVFLPVTVGATMVIAEHGRHGDPTHLADLIRRHGVTVVHFVPAMLAAFNEVLGTRLGELHSLRLVMTGGEALTPPVARDLMAYLPGTRVQNQYGPAEASIVATVHRVAQDDRAVPIGAPTRWVDAYVLDDALDIAPVGVPGELYLGGVQLARGYAGRADLTAERFVADPFGEPGARLYRTGDRARWNAAGELEYLGRNDFQVKLRGQRLELGEVEAALHAAPGVLHAAAAVVDAPGGQQLVGYLAPADVDVDVVAASVAARLPEYMRPGTWARLESMPLNTSGKVDRRSLPEPEFGAVEFVAPETPDEATVAGLFADLLGIEQASVTDSFFDLGGSSLSAARIAARVSDELGVEVTVRDVFDAPSVRELLSAIRGRGSSLPPVVRVESRPERIPLSFAQQRMWFINKLDASNGMYNIPAVLRVSGDLDVEALRAAVGDVVARHETLRTTFPDADGEPFQLVHDVAEIAERLDWLQVDSVADIEAAVSGGFVLEREWPVRVRVWESAPGEHVVAVVMHHIASDGESLAPLVSDLVTAYLARSAGESPVFAPLEVSYADFALWQREVLGSPDDADSVVGRQLAYWTEQLVGLPDVLELPTDRPRPQVATGHGVRTAFEVPPAVTERIRQVADANGVTPFMVLHAALAVTLSRLSGTGDIAISTPIAGRGRQALDPLVGMFVNTLVLRTGVDAGSSFTQLLDHVHTVDIDAFANADVPFEAVVDAVDPVRSEAFAPLAQVMLVATPAGSEVARQVRFGDLEFAPVTIDEVPAQRDLTVNVEIGGAGAWTGSVVAATDLFDASTVDAFTSRLITVLDELTTDPAAAVGDAVVLSADEERSVRAMESGPVSPVPEGTLASAVAASVSAHADRDALVFGERRVSFAEFGARVWGLARELISVGVGPDVAVAVVVPRSVELLVAVHAVVAAGGLYVPVDPDAPADRVGYMLETSGASVVLVAAGVSVPSVVAGVDGVSVLSVDASGSFDAGVSPVTDADRVGSLGADDAVYTLFTSGSTGRPKGVTVSHRSVLNRLAWMDAWYPVSGSDRVLQKTPVTFDVSVWELFWPLMVGVPLVIAEPGRHGDPEYLREVIVRESVSVVHFVPSMLSAFVDVLGDRLAELASLRHVFASGEALAPSVAGGLLSRLPGVGLHNLYGPTEAAVDVTAYSVRAGDVVVPIGSPVPNTVTRVLDSRLARVPVGVPGELYLGGVQVARGYAARPDLTAERFVADPFGGSGERLYRTGDLVRWNASGGLEYLGRTDFQVKLRGQRLELGEVEAAVAAAPGVVHAAAVVAESAAGQQLVAYVAPADVDVDVVAGSVASVLPGYMRPSVWVRLDVMPLTVSGKVDRRALPAPVVEAVEYVAPVSDAEERVAAVFATLLDVERVSVAESFFDLGGNSLSAMRLVARVSDVLGVRVGIRDVFDAPSVRELVAAVADRAAALPPVTRVEPRPEQLPLSRAQRRMWFLNQFDTASGAYNIPAALTLSGDVDETLLFDSVCDVVGRHEILRTVYPSVGAAPVQEVLSAATAREKLDWREADSIDSLIRSTTAGFDVSSQLPIRGRFHRDEAGLHIAITTHHIAMDGQSIPVLARDLMSAYAARAEGRNAGLPALDVQYADYALWQQTVLGDADDETSVLGEQLNHWRRTLAGLPAVTDLPMDRPRPAVLSTSGATVTVEFDDDLADGIDALARNNTMTAFMVTEAAFAATVARLASSTDVVIGTPIAGRNDAALEDLIGMFVNTLLLRTQVDPGRSVGDLLGNVRTTVLDAFANDQVQFDDLIETLAPERSSSYQPLAQIAFTYTEAIDGEAAELEAAGIEAAPVAPGAVNAKFDLTVAIRARGAGAPMAADFIYATDLFDESTVERFAEVYRRVLTAVVENQDIAVGDIDIVGAERVESAPAAAVAVRTPGAMVGRGGEVEAGTLIDVLAQRDLDPDHPALICDGTEIDYDEFETRTNAIARALLARGVSPEDVVAVGMERSIGSVLATWGVIKSGAAYVPVDPAYPADRIAYMLDDSGATVGITDAGTRARLGESVCEWVDLADLEAEAESGDDITDAERNGSVRLTNLAYLIYTSGSTGRPKAVGVSHTGIVDFVNSLAKITTGTPEDEPDTRILHVASPSFDASMFEMAWAIPAGHTLVIAPHTDFAGDALAEVLDRDEVTDMIITPSVLATVDPERAQYVRNLATGGEACPPELVERWSERGRRIFNCYGPTEATVWATRSRLTAGKPVTIGKPVDGFTVRVLDGRLHEVPQGVVGELYLSTAGLARGYLGRPGQTATSFVADPFGEPGARMYATGDLVRVAKGGNLEFAGRADHQVKINGQRVELGEIEAVLDAQPGVAQSVVVGVESTRGARKHTEVVAYLVAKPGATIDSTAVLDEAAQHLAAHMVPSQAIAIDEIPLTPAGKLDRTALPEPHAPEPAEYVAPANPVEENLARIVGGLLGDERISVTESFFALGGDSIMSIQLSSAAKAAGIHLSPREIFELKTIRAMAAAAAASGGPVELIEELPGGGSGDMPLPPVTSWMIEHSEHPSDFADFSQSLVFNVPSAAAIADLQTVVEAVAAAHPMLTAVLTRTGDAWTMTAGAGTVPAVREIDVAGPLDPALVDAHRELLGAMDPETGSLFGTAVVNGEGRRRLVIAIHHLGVDAVSWPVLVEDLVTAWAQLTSGRPIELRPEGTSARRIAHLLADQVDARAAEVDYWLEQLPVRPTSFGDTADRALHRWRDESSLTYVVDDVAGPILTTVPQAFGSSVDDVLLGALARAVRAWQLDNGIDDDGPVTVSTEGHGRDESIAGDHGAIDLSRTVGWFTSITPLAVTASSDVVHAVKSAKDARLSRPAGGVGFGILRYNSDGEIADRPLPTIMYNFFGGGTAPSADTAPDDFLPVSDRPNMPSTITGAMRSPSVFGINISTAGRDEKRLEAKVTYATDVLDETAASDIARRWHEELRAVAALVDGGADLGLSRADVPGVEVTQDDLDLIAEQYPGADVWPMTPLQQGLFFQADLASTVADHDAIDVYVTQTVLSLTGDVDPGRLRAALGELLARQRVLRSGFVRLPSGAAVTVVPAEVTVPWSVIDLRAEDAASHESRVDAVLAAERATPFDMAEPPLIRVVLVEHRDGAELVVTNHHLLIDGWSSPLVLADLLSLYATGETFTGSLPGASGRDFADHARAVATTDIAAGLTAWREVLAPVSEPTLVAPGHEPSADAPPRDHEFALHVEVTERLEALARDNSTTMSTVVQFAWAVFLSRLTGTRTVTFAETVSGRSPEIEGIESMVGMFINTIPAVVDVDPDATVVDVLTAVQNDKVKVLDHQQIGLPMLAAQTGLPALFDTLAVYESFPVNVDSVAGIDASSAGGLKLIGAKTSDATHYPLNLSASRRGAELALKIKYLPTAFAPEQVAVFADVLSELLGAIADGPDATCAELPLLSGEAGVALTPVTGGPAADPVTLADLFRAAVRRAPDDVAVVDGSGARLTYRELDEASDRLARWLIGRGVGPERAVALAIGRSAQLLTAIWAVAKTGGAYVPIDPDYPAERVASMIEDSGAVLGLSVSESGDLPARDFEWVRLDDDSAAAEIAAAPAGPISDAERLGEVTAANLAYVIYTSGSTGRPKGVAVTHSGLANFARQESERLNAGDNPVVLGFASPSFDASVLEYLLATVNSGTLAYRPSEAVGGAALERFIAEHGATHTFLTPSVLSTMDPAAVPSLRVIAAGGEAVPQPIVDRWSGATELHNLYGPTETTIGITISTAMQPGDPVRLGGPIGGVDLMVLDDRLRPVPIGMPGELYVAGGALSRGYLDRSGLTAERFTANPYGEAGQRMYRTGDVVRWTPDAKTGSLTLEYTGRSDDQVKLRGLRIELGEIEAVLAEHSAVESAVVLGVGGSVATALAAYIVPVDGTVEVAELKTFAGRRLPGFMVPSSFTVIDELPLTPVGKLDKRALPEPVLEAGEYVAPAAGTESTIADVVAAVLGIDAGLVSATSSFFELGGDSLSAARLAARLSDQLGVAVSVRDVFEAGSVRALADAVGGFDTAVLPPVTAVTPRPDRVPLSFAQQRIWFINQLEPEAPTYNISVGVRLTGRLDVAALEAAVRDVVARHEVLRTTFPAIDGEPFQLVHAVDSPAAEPDWSVVSGEEELVTAAGSGFDVAAAPPFRVRLLKVADNEHVLLAVLHHLVGDGESMRPLIGNIVSAYLARAAGAAPQFAPLDVQFADYALWQRSALGSPDDPTSVVGRQLDYWARQLAGAPDVLGLPADRPRPTVASHRGAMETVPLPAEVSMRVDDIARERGVTPFMVVHAALAVLLSRLSATDDITVATPIAGRGQQALEPLVGMFVNTLVLRTPVAPRGRFADLLDEVRTVDLEAFAHADVPFEAIVERVQPVRSQAFAPLAQVMVTVVDQTAADPGDGDAAAAGELTIAPVESPVVPAQYDLTVTVGTNRRGDGEVRLVYATDLFDAQSARTLAERLVTVLDHLSSRPDALVADAPLMTRAELDEVLGWSRGASDPPAAETVFEFATGNVR